MAQSFLITAAQGALDGLIRKAEQQMCLGWAFEGDLRKLNEKLTTTQLLLRDAENRKISPEIIEWLTKLQSVISDAESVTDELEYEAVRRKVEVHNKVRGFFSPSNPFTFRLKMVHKVKRIDKLMEKILKKAETILKKANVIGLPPANNIHLGPAYDIGLGPHVLPRELFLKRKKPRESRPNYPSGYSKVAGWDRDVPIVRDMLLDVGSGETGDNLSIIAIVGMGGVGKTTLGQLVYNDEKVVENFAKRMWSNVSDDFNEERLVNEMIGCLQLDTSSENFESARELLRQKLAGGKFLLVLDGIWSTNAKMLVDMRGWFLRISDSHGSKILVTTRTTEVVVVTMEAFPSITYNLDELSGDDSWNIFRKIAFADGGPRETDILVEIGRRIVEKCKGLPYLIESVAELLHSTHEKEWGSIENDETWSSVLNKIRFLQLLRTSFDKLPSPSLKRCFAYCSVFPKGSVIKKDELIQLWMNLGYLHPPPGSSWDMEDLGDAYFRVLLLYSLIQDVEMDEYKNITSCKIHNHIHDLAMHVSEGRRLILEPGGRKTHLEVQHFSLDFWKETSLEFPKGNVEKLRTLLPKLVVHVNHTLAFGLFGDNVEKLPSSIRKLIRLRYLDLSETSIQKLPNFVTKLYNLETLKLPADLLEIPKDFHNLVNLRHYCTADTMNTRKLMPMKIGMLKCLQTLPFFVVGKGSGRRIEELGSLNKLRGRLHVYSLQHVQGREDAKKANISAKLGIQELGFHWDCPAEVGENTNTNNQQDVLEGLQPHSNIRGLILENFGGQRLSSWTALLPNLVKIELRGCSLCEQVPLLGHLPSLEIIEMVGWDNLKCIGPEFCGYNDGGALQAVAFPALRKLTLDTMPMLGEWSLPAETSRTVFFPKLEELYISRCPKFIAIPVHLFSILELTISSIDLSNAESGNRCYPCLTICSPSWDSKYVESCMEDLLEKSSNFLRNLTIRGLSELCYFPNKLWNLVSLERLEIINCSNLNSDINGMEGFNGLTSLQQVSVKQCKNLTHLPEGLLQETLVTLELDSCPNLTPVELHRITSLEHLVIRGCPSLVSCWENRRFSPMRLERLEIGDFSNKLQSFPWPFRIPAASVSNANFGMDSRHCLDCGHSLLYPSTSTSIAVAKQAQQFSFMTLRSLHLWGWEKLAHLPEGLQHLTTLRELSIHSFHLLQALPDWLANISSLHSLEVYSCKNLTSFPRERLTFLLHLTVENCPMLSKRCKRGVGPEWPKIAHVPSVKILFSAIASRPETGAPRELR